MNIYSEMLLNIRNIIFAAILLLTGINDLKKMVIPNRNIACSAVIWLLYPSNAGNSIYVFPESYMSGSFFAPESLYCRGIAFQWFLPALITAAGVYFFSVVSGRLLRKKTMGMGDIKLIFVIFLYLGFQDGMYMMFGALLPAAVYAGLGSCLFRKNYFPFGTFLCLSAVIFLLHPC